jgi:enamine deaminase RidA (YjgF/YER057c/UK114 family)
MTQVESVQSRGSGPARSLGAFSSGDTFVKSFFGKSGGAENFLAVSTDESLNLEGQIAQLEDRYAAAMNAHALSSETAVFRRLFVSDILNQSAAIHASGLAKESGDNPVAVSIVQQPPLSGAKIALLAYHAEDPKRLVKRRLSKNHLLIEKNGRRHLWSTGLCAADNHGSTTAAEQTRDIFANLTTAIEKLGGTLRDHCVRTWIFVKDIDVFYRAMANSRRALFQEQGLTPTTHYLASTGIEGACAHQFDFVAMDAYSILDLAPIQVSYLNDFTRMCPTKDYNITFERGTRIAYADRSHLFISGTASIDRHGNIVRPGNVLAQLDRTLGNIEALLRAGAADFSDLMYLIVYLRDPTDHARVQGLLRNRLPDVPTVIVQASVCRPGWLVEVEGVAISAASDTTLPPY